MIDKIIHFKSSIHQLKRYQEIISLLVQYGFNNIAVKLIPNKILFQKTKKNITKYSTYARFRMLLEDLGPVFIKLGQLLSQRVDLFPLELIHELIKLQDNTRVIDFEEVKPIIEKEIGKIDEIFESFNTNAIASASIAQVYTATYKNKKVVVKLKKPNIDQLIESDSLIMVHIASILEERFSFFKDIGVLDLIKEFRLSLKKETDFQLEFNNIKRFQQNFKNNENVVIPEIFTEISTSSIIVMEYIDGINLGNIEKLKENNINLNKIVEIGFDSVFLQIFKYGFFHADPHGGNIYAINSNRIAYLDFGSVGIITPSQMKILKKLVESIISKNYKKMLRLVSKLTNNNLIISNLELETELEILIEKYIYLSFEDINTKEVFDEITNITRKYKLKIPSNFFLLARALIMFEGLAQNLYPKFNIFEKINKQKNFFIFDYLSPKNIISFIFNNISDSIELLKSLPSEITTVLDLLKIGKIKIEFEHVGLESLNDTIKSIGNRLVSAIILASLIIGSALIIHANLPPKIYNVPIIGIITFIFAAIWGTILLFSMLRKK